MMDTIVGHHLLLDFYGVKHLDDRELIEQALLTAAKACNATVLNCHLHSFGKGLGVTGVLLLAESHISIHSWPETQYAAIDIFMCGNCNPHYAIQPLIEILKPSSHRVQLCERGNKRPDEKNIIPDTVKQSKNVC